MILSGATIVLVWIAVIATITAVLRNDELTNAVH
jgi:hypothetical protein